MFQTVIFDLDGTLLNTIADMAAAGNRVCRANGWPEHTQAEFMAMVGHGIPNLVSKFSPPEAQDPETLARTLAAYSAEYGAHSMERTAPYPGMAALVERLKERGLRLAVYSNKAHAFSEAMVDHYFPGCFHLVRGKLEGVPVKPDRAAALRLMEELGADAASTLFVGDSRVDIQTGHGAGCPVCAVSWGFRPRQTLLEAEFLADTAEELEAVILQK